MGGVLTTFSATEWCGAYGGSAFKEWWKATETERKRHKISENYSKNVLTAIWEQDAGSSSLPTRTMGKSLWDLPFYFVNFHFLLHGNVQLLAVGRLYVEVLFYI